MGKKQNNLFRDREEKIIVNLIIWIIGIIIALIIQMICKI